MTIYQKREIKNPIFPYKVQVWDIFYQLVETVLKIDSIVGKNLIPFLETGFLISFKLPSYLLKLIFIKIRGFFQFFSIKAFYFSKFT